MLARILTAIAAMLARAAARLPVQKPPQPDRPVWRPEDIPPEDKK